MERGGSEPKMSQTYCGNDSMEESWWYRVREWEQKPQSEEKKKALEDLKKLTALGYWDCQFHFK